MEVSGRLCSILLYFSRKKSLDVTEKQPQGSSYGIFLWNSRFLEITKVRLGWPQLEKTWICCFGSNRQFQQLEATPVNTDSSQAGVHVDLCTKDHQNLNSDHWNEGEVCWPLNLNLWWVMSAPLRLRYSQEVSSFACTKKIPRLVRLPTTTLSKTILLQLL